MPRFVGAAPPQERPEPTYRVLRPHKEGHIDVTLLADTVMGVMTHFVCPKGQAQGRTQVCTQHEGECRHHACPLEYAGFLPVWDHVANKRAVLRLAQDEVAALLRVLGTDVNWAGRRVLIDARNDGEGRRIDVSAAPEMFRPAKTHAHPVERTACAVLGCSRIPRQTPPEADSSADVPLPEEGGAR